ncbi:Gfo/Idh/MocA family protein [Membranihabitans maritimus]|uniref:Gfo/Idh/MocA family protein n=1 Tax=Membranihabitans maritimus TaxID=2904244 RepID=UPI001F30899A|nr:Gfo/Idh/MocA family oxidoreductase [Membranihabitans maritimus]
MSNKVSRRGFIESSAAGMAGFYISPGKLFRSQEKKYSSSSKIRMGFIGLGRRSVNLVNGFMKFGNVEIVAGSDVYGVKCDRFKKILTEYYSSKGWTPQITIYENYRDLLERKDIDAVVIATQDHWHALMAIDACKAKKDIYIEKPLTFTVEEGKKLVSAVREHKIVLAVGSQQRSDTRFQHAVRMVQRGKIGTVQKVNAHVGGPPKPFNLPKESLPDDLNWDLWLGPLAADIHYNKELNPPISLNPEQSEEMWGGWRWYKETGGGLTTDWGAHMFDISQWAIGMDRNGPVKIIPPGHEGTDCLTYQYDNGVIMTQEPFDEKGTKGCKFWGTDGWIEVSRGHYKASDVSLNPPEDMDIQGPSHYLDFLESIITRRDPIASVEIGHSTCTTCNIGNIAYELDRPLDWDPIRQVFTKDQDANKHLHRPYRKGYSL